ncbi:conserved oligomeric Golgi complex subunit 1 [Platysternon megacephalum]|uniref:Conserved oligomeric Golgi complex subunit 1 n=1 Tax=Platysternon megacephalum TaxID=55544 RepID=A0A4D9EG77_9SAUR|nr:conserved oligomeric Golgi complex subunit 1 [Platysternon megacephalum]
MAIDWIGFGYAIVVALGGVVGYTRKGSIVSLAAGLFFGLMSGYGAYCVTHDSKDVKISFFSAFILTIVMGMRFKRSKKLIPGGLIAGLSTELFVWLNQLTTKTKHTGPNSALNSLGLPRVQVKTKTVFQNGTIAGNPYQQTLQVN